MGPALGALELEHIARGIAVADAICKRAELELLVSRPISGGKHLIILKGSVAEVEEGMAAGRARAAEALVDSLELPMAHDSLWRVIPDPVVAGDWERGSELSVAIVETSTICALLAAADRACKTAPVELRDVRLGVGISGKAFFTMTGELHDIEAAAAEAEQVAGDRLLASEIIPAPAQELVGRLIF